MELNFFEYLPSKITTNILSSLSIRSLAISKSVCKSWLNLIDSDYFELKTLPALALLTTKERDPSQCAIFEIEDEDEVDADKSHDLHYIPLTDFDIPHRNRGFMEAIPLYMCNLITREYTELRCPLVYIPPLPFKFGFGVSKISGQYKVLSINKLRGSDSEHRVYTLGIGIWRRVEAGATSSFRRNVLESSLFLLPYTRNNEVVIWMMKEYQVEDSWTIEYKLSIIGFDFDSDLDYICVHPIKHFKDGDILMLLDEDDVIYYSNKTRTFQRIDMFKDEAAVYRAALIFTPSFFSLKNFGLENVFSF
ncbi:uncharacterized protein LOC125206699 [Salvia hispanica]|uniref:uncharacterized protein LOC125206699 n=1 Tax=Salvia hispanica TaxID=49212 RepID=UPI002009B97D|nr:uncharacterized protein LOC125206699 [Salvia hispanica]